MTSSHLANRLAARCNLNVPFEHKQRAKSANAKWDFARRTWYAPSYQIVLDNPALEEWVEGSERAELAWIKAELIVPSASPARRDRKLTVTQLAGSLSCEQQIVFDLHHGKQRSTAWKQRGKQGDAAHARYARGRPSNVIRGRFGKRAAPHGSRCFIATACFDAKADELEALRQFRDGVLRDLPAGRAFIKTYYKFSPRIAAGLDRCPALKPPVRHILGLFVRLLDRLQRGRGDP